MTQFEYAILAEYALRYRTNSFPAADCFTVVRRDISSAGKYVYVNHDKLINLANSYYGLGEFSQAELQGLSYGVSFGVLIESGKMIYLEVVVNGNERWDGREESWVIRNPDTGDLPG